MIQVTLRNESGDEWICRSGCAPKLKRGGRTILLLAPLDDDEAVRRFVRRRVREPWSQWRIAEARMVPESDAELGSILTGRVH